MSETADSFNPETAEPKDFRAQFDKLGKQIRERDEKIAQFEAQARATAVKEAVTSLGLPPKVAELIPSDTPADKVGEWVQNYADVFTPKATEQETAPAQTAQGEQFQQAVTQMRHLERTASPAPGDRDVADREFLKALDSNTTTFRDFVDGLKKGPTQ